MKKTETLVLGIGNDILKDDSIGLRLCDHLEQQNKDPYISFKKASLGGLELLDHIQGYDRLIILDAIRTKNGAAGNVYLMDAHPRLNSLHTSNVHNVSFYTALLCGRKLGMRIPEEIRIIAVEIIEDRTFGTELSPKLVIRYKEILAETEKLFTQIMEPV
jgi:hydrogenase maturation protease